jgi:hypothetical protein
MAFQGSLAELHLPDSASGKTGVFHLQDGTLKGLIFLHEGKIVHAQIDETVGEEAVYALGIWEQGEFRFEPGAETEVRTITKSIPNLLMEAAKRKDEWRVLSKKIPSTDLVPEFVVQENREGQINLNTSEWLILSKIDGNRSVKAIAAASGLSVFDAAKMLYGLIATNLIRLREPLPATPAPAAARPAAARPVAPTGGPSAESGSPRPAAAASLGIDLLAKLNRVRDASSSLLGPGGETVVNKHYLKAKGEIERGAGFEAVEEAANQIARAAAILKGPSAAETLLEQIRSLK